MEANVDGAPLRPGPIEDDVAFWSGFSHGVKAFFVEQGTPVDSPGRSLSHPVTIAAPCREPAAETTIGRDDDEPKDEAGPGRDRSGPPGDRRRRRRARGARALARPGRIAGRRPADARDDRGRLPGRGAGDRMGRGDADRPLAHRGAGRVDEADVESGRRGQVVCVPGSRRPGRDRHPRGARDDGDDRRPQAQAHEDRGRPRVRPRAAADQCRLGSEPGVDQPARQRDRRGRRDRPDHDHDPPRARIGGRRDHRRRAGIPPELREQIFDSFFTTKDVGKGSGLGLATARGIVVDRYDGTLDVESEPGRTAFRVWLPLG